MKSGKVVWVGVGGKWLDEGESTGGGPVAFDFEGVVRMLSDCEVGRCDEEAGGWPLGAAVETLRRAARRSV